jgi:hypothetical protein
MLATMITPGSRSPCRVTILTLTRRGDDWRSCSARAIARDNPSPTEHLSFDMRASPNLSEEADSCHRWSRLRRASLPGNEIYGKRSRDRTFRR